MNNAQNNHFQTFTPYFFKNWATLFLLTLLTFSFHIIEFLWGNHDWSWIKEKTPLLSGLFEGRFSQFILQNLLTEGYILPILTLILSLAFYTLAISLLLNILGLKDQKLPFLLAGLFATTSPYTISWLYFAFISLSCLSWPCFIVFAFYLLTKPILKKHSYLLLITSTFLFLLSLGGYPPVINMITSLFFILTIDNMFVKRLTLKSTIKKQLPLAVAILASAFLLLLIQYLLKKYNLQISTYNTAPLSFSDVLSKLNQTLILSFKQFTHTTSFIDYTYKYLTLFLTLISLYVLITKLPKKLHLIILFVILIFCLLLSSVLTTLIAKNVAYVSLQPRIEFFGILYIYIFAISLLLKQENIFLKNLTLLILTVLIFHNINTINYSAKVNSFGFKGETNLINRIINRLEETDIKTTQKHTFVQGGVLNYRERFYTSSPTETTDSYTLSAPYIPWHLPSKSYKFYTQTDYFDNDYDVYWTLPPTQLTLKAPALKHYLHNIAKPWPHKDSIFNQNNLIVFILNQEGLSSAKSWTLR